eukprot:scaffold3513_cov102-Cylindrotheca_fusiformis.AAC.6
MAPNNPHRNSNVIYDMLHGRKRKRSTVTERRAQEVTDGHNPSSTLVSTATAATATDAMVPKGGRVGGVGGHRRRRHRRHKQLAYYKKCLSENPPPQRFSNTSSPPSSSSSIGWLGAISRHRCEQNLMASRLMQLVWLANLGQNYELYTMTNSPMYRLLESHYQKLLLQKKKKEQTNEEALLLLLETSSQWKIQNEQLMQDYQKEHSTKQQIAQEREFLKQNLQTYKEKYSNLKIKYLKQFKRQQAAAAKVMATNALAETPTTNKSKTKKASTSVVVAAPAAAPPNNSPESEETILPSNQQQENQAAGSAKDVVPVNSKPSAKQHPSVHKVPPPPPPPPLSLEEYHESENLLQDTNVPLYHDSPHDVYEASQITFHNGRTTTTTHAAMRQSQKPSIVCLPCNTTTPTTTVNGGGDDSTNVPAGTTTTTVAKNTDLKEDPKTSDTTTTTTMATTTVVVPKKKRRVTLSPNVIVPKNKNPKRNVVVGGYYRGYAPNLYRPPPRPTVAAVVPDVPVSLDATTSRRQSLPPFGREDLPADTTNEEGRDSARLPPNNKETAKQPTATSSTTTTTAATKTTTGSTRWMTNRHNRDFLMEPPSNNNTFKTSKSAAVSPYVRQSIPGASSNQSTNANSATNTTIRYEQVVRKKDDRDQLQRHDCPDCGQFLRAVMEGRGAEVFEQHALLCDSRHRTRYTPPETPEDFWELSFMDEIKARRSTSSPTTTTTKEDER